MVSISRRLFDIQFSEYILIQFYGLLLKIGIIHVVSKAHSIFF